MPDPQYDIPNDPDVTPEDIKPGADLRGADLTDATLRSADLTSADLRGADLTDATLRGAYLTDVGLSGADLTGVDLSGADLTDATLFQPDLTDADLSWADLPGADLYNADLTGANLAFADLTGANLGEADLTCVDLSDADLTDADLRRADLTDADLEDADLSGADLRGHNLSDQNLSGVNLSRADLRGVDMIGMSANQATRVGKMCTRASPPDQYDELAQGYHELKEVLSQQGLSQRARQARGIEQQARTAEAWRRFNGQTRKRVRQLQTLSGWRQGLFPPWPDPEVRTQFLTAVGGTLSRYLTGYGTRPLYVLLWTAAIILTSTALFAFGPAPADEWRGGPLYYSVVTFVTAPPHPPRGSGIVTRTAVLIETYVGTALIVLLGYVLGTRERV